MDRALEAAILRQCEQLFPAVVGFTRQMIEAYSVLGQETPALHVVERQLRDLALPVSRVPMRKEAMAASPLYAPVDWDHEQKYNLVSSLNPGASGRRLVLNGHLDVVSAEPFDMWSRPPNVPWERDGWLYGRGAGDMQSGVAAMIFALHAVHEAGCRIRSPLNVQVVVEEECSGNGALACLQHGYTGDFVLIPEPFGPKIYTGQIGVLWFRVEVRGTPAHVLDTTQGASAIEKLWAIVPWLKQLEDELNRECRAPPYDRHSRPCCLNIGRIEGGNWPSSVAAHAVLEGRIGFPPGMSVHEVMQRLERKIAAASRADSSGPAGMPAVKFHGFRSEGHLVDLNHEGIQLLGACHNAITARQIEHYLSTCTTDLRAFHFHDGTVGTCYGPLARNIHGVDECVNLESVRLTLQTYALFIARWCDVVAA